MFWWLHKEWKTSSWTCSCSNFWRLINTCGGPKRWKLLWAIGRELKLFHNLLTTHLDMACIARHTSSAFFNVTEMLCSLIMTSVFSLIWKQTLYWPCQCWSSDMWTVCCKTTLSQRLHYEMKCYHWVYPQTQIRFKNSLFFSLHSLSVWQWTSVRKSVGHASRHCSREVDDWLVFWWIRQVSTSLWYVYY
jgi:hypothetical protein